MLLYSVSNVSVNWPRCSGPGSHWKTLWAGPVRLRDGWAQKLRMTSKKSLLSSRFSMICVANYAWVSAAGLWAIQYSRSITTKTWPWDLNTSEVVSHRKRRFTADNMQPHIQALRVGPSICWTWFRIADSWPCWSILIQKITSLQRETKTHAVYSGWQCGSCW